MSSSDSDTSESASRSSTFHLSLSDLTPRSEQNEDFRLWSYADDSCRHVDYALTSPYGGGRPGRTKRKRAKAAAGAEGGDDAEEEDDE